MTDSFLAVRLEALRRAQGSDGGWGYFSGKRSWLEPTAYAAMALMGDPAADRAWALLESWQMSDGSWRPSAGVQVGSWGTSLCVTLAVARREWGDPLRKGISWLLDSEGVDSNWFARAAASVGLFDPGRDFSVKGWPWKEGTSSWVEPTAHALVALKKVALEKVAAQKSVVNISSLPERVRSGEAQLLDIRCHDGGWNYGNRTVLGDDLRSYPETTGLALLGLQGVKGAGKSIDLALKMVQDGVSPMARAWLTVALRLHGVQPPPLNGPATTGPAATPDILITAVEALAAPEGNYRLMQTESAT